MGQLGSSDANLEPSSPDVTPPQQASPPTTSILYQSPSSDVTLIDIPLSLALSQGLLPDGHPPTLLSTSPPKHPYPSLNEPMSASAKAKLQTNTVNEAYHAELRLHTDHALKDIRAHHTGPWCAPRTHLSPHPPSLPSPGPSSHPAPPGIQQNTFLSLESLPPTPLSNSTPHPSTIHTLSPHPTTYLIPPTSTFTLASIPPTSFPFPPSKTFSLILLDPPWPNRSASRLSNPSQKYARCWSLPETRRLLLSLPISALLPPYNPGLVAVWTTNKPAIRSLTLDLFATSWGLTLVEEWVWLKVTDSGQPVSDMESAWRKPYEVLLIGRRDLFAATGHRDRPREKAGDGEMETDVQMRRRVVVAVPDLHSRKPCLRELVPGLFSAHGVEVDTEGRGVLEVFARNLTAGWWSWGDECLKFQEWGASLVAGEASRQAAGW